VIAIPLTLVLPPERILLPNYWSIDGLYLGWTLVAAAEGFLIGLLQHARERGLRTQAYLLHRGTGPLQAFLSKVLCGLAAVSLAVALPPLVYWLWHVVLSPSVEDPLNERLVHFLAFGAAGIPAYGLGGFVAQLRCPWWSRVLLGLVGSLTVFLVPSMRWTAGDEWTMPIVPVLIAHAGLASFLLAGAYRLFRAGEDTARPWPAYQGLVAAALVLPLVFLPWIYFIGNVQARLRLELLGTYPQVVEDAENTLYFVNEVQPVEDGHRSRWQREYELWSSDGLPIRDERVRRYSGFGWDFDPFLTVFDPGFTPLQLDGPGDGLDLARRYFGGFDGAWIALNFGHEWPRDRWFHPADGTIHFVGSRIDDPTMSTTPHEVRGRPDKSFSLRTLVLDSMQVPHLSAPQRLLIDLDDHTLWFARATAEDIAVESLTLPGGDTLVGLERLYSTFLLRAGLYEPSPPSDAFLLVGSKGRYLWTNEGIATVEDDRQLAENYQRKTVPASAAEGFIAWRMEPSKVDGLGFHLDVFDVKTGQLALQHDYRPESSAQRRLAAFAWLCSLARPPIGSLWSSFGAQTDPRDVVYARVSVLRDPLLLGGSNPHLLWTSVGLGAFLALSVHRRLRGNPHSRAVCWTWTGAVALFGIPAWLVCQMVEPSRRGLALRLRSTESASALLIESQRSTPVLKPALSGV
jgi:hypothetical protein